MRKWRRARTIVLTTLALSNPIGPAEETSPDDLISNSPPLRRLFWRELKSLVAERRELLENNGGSEKLTLRQVSNLVYGVVKDVLRRARVVQHLMLSLATSNKTREEARVRSEYEASLELARAAREASLRAKKEAEEAKQKETAEREATNRKLNRRASVAMQRHQEAVIQVTKTTNEMKVEGIKRQYLHGINALVKQLASSMAALQEMYSLELSDASKINESMEAVRHVFESMSELLALQAPACEVDVKVELEEDEEFRNIVREFDSISHAIKGGSVADVVSCLETIDEMDESLSHRLNCLFPESEVLEEPGQKQPGGQKEEKEKKKLTVQLTAIHEEKKAMQVRQPSSSIAASPGPAAFFRKARPSPLITISEPPRHQEEHFANCFDSGGEGNAEVCGDGTGADATPASASALSSSPASPINSVASTNLPLGHARVEPPPIVEIGSPITPVPTEVDSWEEHFTADGSTHHRLQRPTLDEPSVHENELPDVTRSRRPAADRKATLNKIRQMVSWRCVPQGEEEHEAPTPTGAPGVAWGPAQADRKILLSKCLDGGCFPMVASSAADAECSTACRGARELMHLNANPKHKIRQEGSHGKNMVQGENGYEAAPAIRLSSKSPRKQQELKKAFKTEIQRARDLKDAWQPPGVYVWPDDDKPERSWRRCVTLDDSKLRQSMITPFLEHEPPSPKDHSGATSSTPRNRAGRLGQNTSENSPRLEHSMSKASSRQSVTPDESNLDRPLSPSPKERSITNRRASWQKAWRVVSPVAAFQQLPTRPAPAMLSEGVSPAACPQPSALKYRPVTPIEVAGAEEAAIQDGLRIDMRSSTPDVSRYICAVETVPNACLGISSVSKGWRTTPAAKYRRTTTSDEISIEEVRCASKSSSCGVATKARPHATSETNASEEETNRGGLCVTPTCLSPRPPSSAERTFPKPAAANMTRRYLQS